LDSETREKLLRLVRSLSDVIAGRAVSPQVRDEAVRLHDAIFCPGKKSVSSKRG